MTAAAAQASGRVGGMVSSGVIGAMLATTVGGKVLAMWMPITLFFGMTFEHSVVNMFLFPSALMMGGDFSVADYIVWNELPTVIGNLVGGITFTGLSLYATHLKTAPKRVVLDRSIDESGVEPRARNRDDAAA